MSYDAVRLPYLTRHGLFSHAVVPIVVSRVSFLGYS
jgi:hypothetical protein